MCSFSQVANSYSKLVAQQRVLEEASYVGHGFIVGRKRLLEGLVSRLMLVETNVGFTSPGLQSQLMWWKAW